MDLGHFWPNSGFWAWILAILDLFQRVWAYFEANMDQFRPFWVHFGLFWEVWAWMWAIFGQFPGSGHGFRPIWTSTWAWIWAILSNFGVLGMDLDHSGFISEGLGLF